VENPLLNSAAILRALNEGQLDLQGQFVRGSNYTFLAQVNCEGMQFPAVYKPVRGEQPLWDFPVNSLAKREVAAYAVSQALGWELVPPTVLRRKGPLGRGSLQYFVPHDPNQHYFNLSETERQRLRPAVVFDLLINNADRKGSHILLDAEEHIWLIDHGVCFHAQDKLRTVVWDFLGESIPEALLGSLESLLPELELQGSLYQALRPLLRVSEIRALAGRARQLLEAKHFPRPDPHRRPYPYPPV
jgi:uncharacterized repeat protein (TIGR03843 family)